MKYNPKLNEDVAVLPGFAQVHPYQPEEPAKERSRCYTNWTSICLRSPVWIGLPQPAAGAHGELTA